ncbi:MAG: hypothetical protein LBM27_05880 [Lactobacillaceae bacterium]|jgi:hypothetical protein|nr:hypothetical protein [Lactobacillaceae bacterium]
MKFIHFSDANLGRPITDTVIKTTPQKEEVIFNSLFTSFENIVKYAISKEVDFIVISGGLLFQEVNVAFVQDFLDQQFSLLADKNINVFITMDINRTVNFSDNVYVFTESGDTQIFSTPDGTSVAISGASKTQSGSGPDTFKSMPIRNNEVNYHIGVLNGVVSDVASTIAVSVDQLTNLGYDYFALGGAKNVAIMNQKPFIAYPGAVQGTNPSESGAHGVIYVETDETGTLKPDFIHTNAIEFHDIEIPVDVKQPVSKIIEAVAQQLPESIFSLYSVNLVSSDGTFNGKLFSETNFGNFAQQLNKMTEDKNFYVASVAYSDPNSSSNVLQTSIDQGTWNLFGNEIFKLDNLSEVVTKRFKDEAPFVLTDLLNDQVMAKISQNAKTLVNHSEEMR